MKVLVATTRPEHIQSLTEEIKKFCEDHGLFVYINNPNERFQSEKMKSVYIYIFKTEAEKNEGERIIKKVRHYVNNRVNEDPNLKIDDQDFIVHNNQKAFGGREFSLIEPKVQAEILIRLSTHAHNNKMEGPQNKKEARTYINFDDTPAEKIKLFEQLKSLVSSFTLSENQQLLNSFDTLIDTSMIQ